MKRTTQKPIFTTRLLSAAALLVALTAFATPAMAYTPAEGAKILNVVAVHYEGTDGTGYDANASTLVTVTLAPAPLTLSGAPNAGSPGDTAGSSCPPAANSGTTSTVMNAVSANANGDDSYTLAINNIVGTNTGSESVTFTLYNSAGATIVADVATTSLNGFGSTLIVGVEDADTLRVDGGVDINTMFSAGDIVVVKTAGGNIDYKVVSAVNGTAVSHENAGNVDHADLGATLNANAYGLLTLEAFQVTIGSTTYGSNTTPDFVTSPPVAGDVVGEMVLVEVSVSANATSQTADGTVAFDFDTADSGAANTTSDPCTVTFYQAAELTIKKEVRNLDDAVPTWGATANGAPGNTLEYRVTVTNPDASDANLVVITDAVPTYTTLVADAYGAGIFAQADLNASGTPTDITGVATDTEDGAVASGDAAGTAAGSAITFYVGNGNVGTGTPAGGTLAGSDAVVITYQVTID